MSEADRVRTEREVRDLELSVEPRASKRAAGRPEPAPQRGIGKLQRALLQEVQALRQGERLPADRQRRRPVREPTASTSRRRLVAAIKSEGAAQPRHRAKP